MSGRIYFGPHHEEIVDANISWTTLLSQVFAVDFVEFGPRQRLDQTILQPVPREALIIGTKERHVRLGLCPGIISPLQFCYFGSPYDFDGARSG